MSRKKKVLNVDNYIDNQIQLEENYYNKLYEDYSILIGMLSLVFKENRGKYAVLDQVATWKRLYYNNIANANAQTAVACDDLVKTQILPKIAKDNIYLPRAIAPIVRDLTINTDNLTNTISGIFITAIPVALVVTEKKYRAEDLEELITRCENSIKRNVQQSVSQAVIRGTVTTALDAGYTQYQSGNEKDDKVRETHKETNDFETWHDLLDPPEIGYPGQPYFCRCFWTGFR